MPRARHATAMLAMPLQAGNLHAMNTVCGIRGCSRILETRYTTIAECLTRTAVISLCNCHRQLRATRKHYSPVRGLQTAPYCLTMLAMHSFIQAAHNALPAAPISLKHSCRPAYPPAPLGVLPCPEPGNTLAHTYKGCSPCPGPGNTFAHTNKGCSPCPGPGNTLAHTANAAQCSLTAGCRVLCNTYFCTSAALHSTISPSMQRALPRRQGP
jgi:hypothetical protein